MFRPLNLNYPEYDLVLHHYNDSDRFSLLSQANSFITKNKLNFKPMFTDHS